MKVKDRWKSLPNSDIIRSGKSGGSSFSGCRCVTRTLFEVGRKTFWEVDSEHEPRQRQDWFALKPPCIQRLSTTVRIKVVEAIKALKLFPLFNGTSEQTKPYQCDNTCKPEHFGINLVVIMLRRFLLRSRIAAHHLVCLLYIFRTKAR